MDELTPEQRRARIRAYVEACDVYGYPEGVCAACGEPWSIHPGWCPEYPDAEEEDPLAAFMTGVIGLAMLAALLSPRAQTGDVIQVVRDNLAELSKDRGGSMDNQQQRDAAEEAANATLITGGDDEDDGSEYFRALDRHDQDAPATPPAQDPPTTLIVEQYGNGVGDPITMTAVGVRPGGPPIALDIDRRARYVSLSIPMPKPATIPAAPSTGDGVQGREETGVVRSPMDGSATDQSAG